MQVFDDLILIGRQTMQHTKKKKKKKKKKSADQGSMYWKTKMKSVAGGLVSKLSGVQSGRQE